MNSKWDGVCILRWASTRVYSDDSITYSLKGIMLHRSDPAIEIEYPDEEDDKLYAICYDCNERLNKPSEVLVHIAEHQITRPGPRGPECYGAEEQLFEWLRIAGDCFEVTTDKEIIHEHSVRHHIRY